MFDLIKIIFFPITFLFYMMKYGIIAFGYIIYFCFNIFKLFFYFILWIIEIIMNLFGISCNFSHQYSVNRSNVLNVKNDNLLFKTNNKNNKKGLFNQKELEKEAKLWGVSKEDKRIIKK